MMVNNFLLYIIKHSLINYMSGLKLSSLGTHLFMASIDNSVCRLLSALAFVSLLAGSRLCFFLQNNSRGINRAILLIDLQVYTPHVTLNKCFKSTTYTSKSCRIPGIMSKYLKLLERKGKLPTKEYQLY